MKTLPFENSEKKITRKKTPEKNQELILWQQIQLIYTFLQKPNNWYTGLTIKKYLRKKIFGNNQLTNSHILSGRWSAYSHFSHLESFKNLITKFQLKNEAKILTHPLIPAEFVQELINQNFQVESFDIDKNTLNWNPLDLKKKIEINYDLIIFFSFNGLVEEIQEIFPILKKKVIPVLLILENTKLNDQIKEFLNHFSGGVLWNFGQFFWSDFVNSITNYDFKNIVKVESLENTFVTQNCYFSWFTENRTRSILENHLSESHEINQKIAESLFYLLVQKWQKFSLQNYLVGIFRGFFLTVKIKNPKEAVEIIKNNWEKSLRLAIPDLFLELQDVSAYNSSKVNLQVSAQEWQKYFVASVPQRKKGGLEVPSFFLSRQYLRYFVYTTEREFWTSFILTSQKTNFESIFEKNIEIHPIISGMNLPNTDFVSQYILILKI